MAVDEQSGSDSCATFVLSNEDHSLGNSLRWMLSKEYVTLVLQIIVDYASVWSVNCLPTQGQPSH